MLPEKYEINMVVISEIEKQDSVLCVNFNSNCYIGGIKKII